MPAPVERKSEERHPGWGKVILAAGWLDCVRQRCPRLGWTYVRHRDENDPVEPPAPAWRETFNSFPGPFAVADRELAAGERARVETEGLNGLPWAISLYYEGPDGPVLTVRTVRSAEGIEMHGTPAEDLPTVLSRFINLRSVAGESTAEDRFNRTSALKRSIMQRAGVQAPETVAVEIDSAVVEAALLEVDGVAAVSFPWQGQTVLCAAPAASIASLRLKTGLPEEFIGAA